jgi:hypothetical protein
MRSSVPGAAERERAGVGAGDGADGDQERVVVDRLALGGGDLVRVDVNRRHAATTQPRPGVGGHAGQGLVRDRSGCERHQYRHGVGSEVLVRRQDRGADSVLRDALEPECRLERGGAAPDDEGVKGLKLGHDRSLCRHALGGIGAPRSRWRGVETRVAADHEHGYRARVEHRLGDAPEQLRLFSKERTWEALEAASGGVVRATLDVERLGDALATLRTRQPIYTAAFILAAPRGFGYRAKHRNHLALVRHMFRPRGLGAAIGRARSLRDVYEALLEYPAIGPFLAYQIAVDLNYSAHLDFSEDDFTIPGPGGLAKVFADSGGRSPVELIMRMVGSQEEHFERLGVEFPGLFGRRLHAIDCQSLFCETDKYARVAFPELASNRSRIRQQFRPSHLPLALCFPPKWGLDVGGPRTEEPEVQLSAF